MKCEGRTDGHHEDVRLDPLVVQPHEPLSRAITASCWASGSNATCTSCWKR